MTLQTAKESCTHAKQHERVAGYDFLRVVGILCIVLAHVWPRDLLFQLRNFDVTLMVALSGISFSLFSMKKYPGYARYVWGRFSRLVLPAWLFLIIWFIFQAAIGGDYTTTTIIKSFFLMDACGWGIWIIRIFFAVSLVAPAVWYINGKIRSDTTCFAVMIGCIALYVMLYLRFKHLGHIVSLAASLLPYIFIFWFGVRISGLSKTTQAKAGTLLLACFFAIEFYLYYSAGSMPDIQDFKYPPMPLYIAYSLAVSTLLIAYSGKFPSFITDSHIVKTISSSTLWFYFWHWIALHFVSLFITGSYTAKYVAVLFTTYVIVACQRNIVDHGLLRFCPRLAWCRKFIVC